MEHEYVSARDEYRVQSSPEPSQRKIGSAALKAFFAIASAKWGLSTGEQRILLGGISESTYHTWKNNPDRKLTNDVLDRISYILGIYKNLEILLGTKDIAQQWIKKPNDAFDGKSAIEVMLGGRMANLSDVRHYLDSQRG